MLAYVFHQYRWHCQCHCSRLGQLGWWSDPNLYRSSSTPWWALAWRQTPLGEWPWSFLQLFVLCAVNIKLLCWDTPQPSVSTCLPGHWEASPVISCSNMSTSVAAFGRSSCPAFSSQFSYFASVWWTTRSHGMWLWQCSSSSLFLSKWRKGPATGLCPS